MPADRTRSREIDWQDIRLVAGEGKLSPGTVLHACNVIHRQRIASAVSENNEACAKIADTVADQENVLYVSNVKRGAHERATANEAARDAAHAVAETIRSREAAHDTE